MNLKIEATAVTHVDRIQRVMQKQIQQHRDDANKLRDAGENAAAKTSEALADKLEQQLAALTKPEKKKRT